MPAALAAAAWAAEAPWVQAPANPTIPTHTSSRSMTFSATCSPVSLSTLRMRACTRIAARVREGARHVHACTRMPCKLPLPLLHMLPVHVAGACCRCMQMCAGGWATHPRNTSPYEPRPMHSRML